jgi:hypothetical protein
LRNDRTEWIFIWTEAKKTRRYLVLLGFHLGSNEKALFRQVERGEKPAGLAALTPRASLVPTESGWALYIKEGRLTI